MSVKGSARGADDGLSRPRTPELCRWSQSLRENNINTRTSWVINSWVSNTAHLQIDTTATACVVQGTAARPPPQQGEVAEIPLGLPTVWGLGSGLRPLLPSLPSGPTSLAAQWTRHHPCWGTGGSSSPEGLPLEAETVTNLCLHTRTSSRAVPLQICASSHNVPEWILFFFFFFHL